MNYNIEKVSRTNARRTSSAADFERNKNVIRDKRSKSDMMPFDLMAAKYDETDMYLPDDSYHNFAREMIVDRSADSVVLEEDMVSQRPSRNALDIRLGNDKDPSNPEAFLGDLEHGNDRPDGNPRFDKLTEQNRYRTRYEVFKPDDGERETSGVWTQKSINNAYSTINKRLKNDAKFFSPSTDSLLYKQGPQSIGDLRYAITGDRNDGILSEDQPAEEAFTGKSAPQHGRHNSSGLNTVDTEFSVALIGSNGKTARVKDHMAARRNKTDNTESLSNGVHAPGELQTAHYRSAARMMNDIVTLRHNTKNDTVFGANVENLVGQNKHHTASSFARRDVTADVIVAKETELALKRMFAQGDLTAANRAVSNNEQLAHELNARTMGKVMSAKDGKKVARETLVDPKQFAEERTARGVVNASHGDIRIVRKEIGSDRDYSTLPVAVIYGRNSSRRPDAASGRSDIAHDGQLLYENNSRNTGKNSAPRAEERMKDRMQEIEDALHVHAKIDRAAPKPRHASLQVDKFARDDAREI